MYHSFHAHSVNPPLSAGGLSLQPSFQKKWRGVAGKEGRCLFFGGGGCCNCHVKKKTKSEKFNDKKIL